MSVRLADIDKLRLFMRDAKVRFHVPQLLSHGMLKCHGVVVKTYPGKGNSTSIPLIIFSVSRRT